MKHYEKTTRVTLYATRAVAVVVAVLVLCFPVLVERYHQNFRPLASAERIAIIAGFYASSVAILPALWNIDRLMGNILRARLFIIENVNHIRAVRWCCVTVSLICLLAAFGFPSLLFLSVIMAFLSMVVNVVCQVMKAAVAMREESDLTI